MRGESRRRTQVRSHVQTGNYAASWRNRHSAHDRTTVSPTDGLSTIREIMGAVGRPGITAGLPVIRPERFASERPPNANPSSLDQRPEGKTKLQFLWFAG